MQHQGCEALFYLYKLPMIYKRIFLKISWEALAGVNASWWLDHEYMRSIAKNINALKEQWVQVALMVWAGNIFRGREQGKGIDEAIGHYAGMLATMVNALILQNIMHQEWIQSSVFSAIEMPRYIKTINKISAIKRLENDHIVICAWGSGNPFCTTDLWSVIRALELDCDILVKCSGIDGVYSADPKKDPSATRYERLSYTEALSKWLKIMDQSAFGMAMENKLTTYVTHIDSLSTLDFSPAKWTLILPWSQE
jgi:uridylate kinase